MPPRRRSEKLGRQDARGRLKGGGLKLQERPEPVPGSDELLVKAEASGINAADISHRTGSCPAPPGAPVDIPGLELAGTVVAEQADAAYERFTQAKPGKVVLENDR